LDFNRQDLLRSQQRLEHGNPLTHTLSSNAHSFAPLRSPTPLSWPRVPRPSLDFNRQDLL
jgi:hypothetical protein